MTKGVMSVPGWEQFGWLRAGFSVRTGGETSVYGAEGELNLGWTAEDDPTIVAANRRSLMASVAGESSFELVTVRQVHGSLAHRVERGRGVLTYQDGKAILQGDGLFTREPGLMLGIQTADCVPVLIADTRTRAIGASHAGWRGTVAQIVELGVSRMRREFGTNAADIVAAIGPSIGPCCFEVGGEVASEFERAFDDAPNLFSRAAGGKQHINLWEANRRQLLASGVPEAAISVLGECPACTRTSDRRRKFFSYRAEKGVTGRMLNVIGIEPE